MNILKRTINLATTKACADVRVQLKSPMAKHYPASDPNSIITASQKLASGRVIGVPTDTLYGLACDATNPAAVDKLFKIKCRDEYKPVAICVGRISDINKYADVDHIPGNLLEELVPGPVTLILPCRTSLVKSLTYQKKVGIRIPDCDFIRSIANCLNRPLALTSANISSKPSPLTVDDFCDLWSRISIVFDGGRVNSSREGSTIIDLSYPDTYRILRPGIAEAETIAILEKFGLVKKD